MFDEDRQHKSALVLVDSVLPSSVSGLAGVSERVGNAALLQGLLLGGDAAVMSAWGAQMLGLTAADPFASNAAMQRVLRSAQEGSLPTGAVAHLEALLSASSGAPLPPAVVARMSAVMGHDFSGVRVHTDAPAAQAAQAIAARAFAVGSEIYFAPGQLQPQTPAGEHLLAHELAHVLQHEEGRLPTASGPSVSHPHDPAEREAEARADAACDALRMTPEEVETPPDAQPPAESLSSSSSWLREAEGAAPVAAETAQGAGASISSKMLEMIRIISPTLADFLESGWEARLSALLETLLGEQLAKMSRDLLLIVPGIVEGEGPLLSLADTVRGVAQGDPRCCETFEGWLSAFKATGESWMQSTWTAELFARCLTDLPEQWAFPLIWLRDGVSWLLGDAWGAVEPMLLALIDSLEPALEAVRRVDVGLASWIADTLGLDDLEGGGHVALVTQLAETVTQELMRLYEGAMSGLMSMVMSAPLVEEAYRMVDAVLDVTEGVSWLYENRDDPFIVQKAHREMGHSWVPQFLESGTTFLGSLRSLVTHIQTDGREILEEMDRAAQRAGEAPILVGLVDHLGALIDGLSAVVYSPIWSQLWEGFSAFVDFGGDVLGVFADVLVCIGTAQTDPWSLLCLVTGEAFLLLPDCYKTAIFDALLPYAVALVDTFLPAAFVPFGVLGLGLFPSVRAAFQGAVCAVRTRPDADKARLLEGLARFLSGKGRIDLIEGFVLGLCTGLYREVRDIVSFLMMVSTMGLRAAKAVMMIPLRLGWMGMNALDELGDRHFKEDAYTEREVGGGSVDVEVEPSADRGTQVSDLALMLRDLIQNGISDASIVELFRGLWLGVMDALDAMGMMVMDALIEKLLWLQESPGKLGQALGELTIVFVGEALLTKGAATLAAQVPRLAAALDALLALLKAPDVAGGILASGLRKVVDEGRGLLGGVTASLRSLDNPLMNLILDILSDLFSRLMHLLRDVEQMLEWTPEKGVVAAELQEAMAGGPGVMVGLTRAAERLGDAELKAIVQKALVERHQAGSRTLRETAEANIREALEELGKNWGKPSWYDTSRSPEENLREYLLESARAAILDAEEGDLEAESADSPVPDMVWAARRLGEGEQQAIAAQAVLGRPVAVQTLAREVVRSRVEAIRRAGTFAYDEGLYRPAESPKENLIRHLEGAVRASLG